MKKLIEILSSFLGKGRVFRLLFNLSPMYRTTGGRVMKVTDDLQYVKIKLALTLRTRNYVGTLYGGHMYSALDGIYMVQLINILGHSYVVWDKSAYIRFRKPGNKTLFAEFIISDELVQHIKDDIRQQNEKNITLKVHLVDMVGVVHAEVEKVIYIANKDFYRKKKRR